MGKAGGLVWAPGPRMRANGLLGLKPKQVQLYFRATLADLQLIHQPASSQQSAAPPRQTAWIPPPVEHMKINVDAAVSRAGGFGAVATICRDYSGAFQGPSAVIFRNIDDPEVLETLAIREALAVAEDLYTQKIFPASDCKVVVDAIKGGTSASYGVVVHEIIAHS